ncbi:S1C family serine protease [Pantanalinema sp. GBBB05]|uniref:S1C family serine protease n=1 Tax=Pantanalinema sp. GBBB05 TaxID=2604139 RepID=UPI001D42DCFE|nr:trypsin-like serine protease [Pantanalinema sp. GBBB05]
MAKVFWSVLLAIVLVWAPLPYPAKAEPLSPVPAAVTQSAFPFSPFESHPQVTIEIARIRSGLLPGAFLGGHHEGFLHLLQQHYTASGWLDEQLEEALRRLLEDELAQAGYHVAATPSSSVFEEQLVEELEPGRFLLGGTIIQAALNSYSSLFGDMTQDERTVRWEVFDRDRGKVIYRQETVGKAQAEGIKNPAATYDAIKASFQALLTSPQFVAVLQRSPTPEPTTPATSYTISALPNSAVPMTVEQIAGQAIPAIVRIRTPLGRGTGFLLSHSGLAITNQHVVGSAFSVKVDLYDGSTRTGRVMKRDATSDIALVKLEGEETGVAGLPICQTNAVKVGETVVAIGNPLSYTNSVTQGVVSGFRTMASRSLIQTDAAVNPGNSGGPLLNRFGAVIGIVTEKIASRGVEGLGFAVPIAESLQKLNVQITTPTSPNLTACGNPTRYS